MILISTRRKICLIELELVCFSAQFHKMASDDLRCDEVLTQDLNSQDLSQFCCAYKDGAILNDSRVFQNMLELEDFYLPDSNSYQNIQDEIKIHMRKIVTEWMLDVCLYQRCHPDVFLLATNILDRFLQTIKIQKKQFQLLGAASIFLASKMIEPQPIAALTLVNATADTYDREELLVSAFYIQLWSFFRLIQTTRPKTDQRQN